MAQRQPTEAPRQKRISVQDVRDYASPAGAAAANEEMRRLALSVAELQDRLEQPDGGSHGNAVPADVSSTTTIVNNYGGTETASTLLCGIVTLRHFASSSALEDFAREAADYGPESGRYGRPVYGIIPHGLGLSHPDAHVLELTDLQELSGGLHETPHEFLPQVYGLDENRIIVWVVLKAPVQLLDGELVGAPRFFFMLTAGECIDITADGPSGLVLAGEDFRLWTLLAGGGGSLRLERAASGPARDIVLAGAHGARWRLEVDAGGSLVTRRVPAVTPAVTVRLTSGTSVGLLGVGEDGSLTVWRE